MGHPCCSHYYAEYFFLKYTHPSIFSPPPPSPLLAFHLVYRLSSYASLPPGKTRVTEAMPDAREQGIRAGMAYLKYDAVRRRGEYGANLRPSEFEDSSRERGTRGGKEAA